MAMKHPLPRRVPCACEKEGPWRAEVLQAGGGRRWSEAREGSVPSGPWGTGSGSWGRTNSRPFSQK